MLRATGPPCGGDRLRSSRNRPYDGGARKPDVIKQMIAQAFELSDLLVTPTPTPQRRDNRALDEGHSFEIAAFGCDVRRTVCRRRSISLSSDRLSSEDCGALRPRTILGDAQNGQTP